MRGAGPSIPRKGLAPTFSHPTATLQLCSDEPIESRGARQAKGTQHESNPAKTERPRPAAGSASAVEPRQRKAALRALVRAREAQLAGDVVEMENCYQHAEH